MSPTIIQGNTGVLLGMLLVSSVVLVALVTVMSGIGVCEHCGVGGGGIYSMISIVLGGRLGGTVGLLYVFGQVSNKFGLSSETSGWLFVKADMNIFQLKLFVCERSDTSRQIHTFPYVVSLLVLPPTPQCVAGAMYITGFSESVAELLGLQSQWAVRGMSAAVLLALLGINLAGVKWIVRLQLLLLAVLAVSTLDFVIGTFAHLDPGRAWLYIGIMTTKPSRIP